MLLHSGVFLWLILLTLVFWRHLKSDRQNMLELIKRLDRHNELIDIALAKIDATLERMRGDM